MMEAGIGPPSLLVWTMELRIAITGDIVERQELLNGTQTITLEGASDDAVWTLVGSVSWNRGLVEYAGEGDLALTRDDGAEVFATLATADAVDDPVEHPDADHQIILQYEIDGGSGAFAGALGSANGSMFTEGDRFEGTWVLTLDR
jgi:hypothetical protein